VYSLFNADTCSNGLGVPTCGLWIPDTLAFLKLLVNQAPPFLGGWCLIGIVAASMSTAGGAIHAMGTVVSNNLVRQLDSYIPGLVTYDNLIEVARILSIPVTIISACIAAYYESSSASAGGTGYLLIVAFDIVLATVVVPLLGCFYAAHPSPRAALLAILGGAVTRSTLEYTIPKDGYLIMPYDDPAFMSVGPAASIYPPGFIDTNQTTWNPDVQPCQEVPYEDYTGVDSLAGFAVCLSIYLSVQFVENRRRKPLFRFPRDHGYVKDTKERLRPAHQHQPPKLVKPSSGVHPEDIVKRFQRVPSFRSTRVSI
jgi:Na+/proline symporter